MDDKIKADVLGGLHDRLHLSVKDFSEYSYPQKVFVAVEQMQCEVNCEGFAAYLAMFIDEGVPIIVESLETIGALGTAAFLRRALNLVYPAGIPKDAAIARKMAQELSSELEQELDELLDAFFNSREPMLDLVWDYVINNPDDFGVLVSSEVDETKLDQTDFEPWDNEAESERFERPIGLGIGIVLPAYQRYHFGHRELGAVSVVAVEMGSAGERAGFAKGDLILEVDGSPVNSLPGSSTDLLTAVVAKLKSLRCDSNVRILIRRGDEERLITLTL